MRGIITNDQQQTSIITQEQIAEHCGVSVSTVSLALHGDTRLKAATVERVLSAAREMGYDPSFSHAARRLVYKRTGTKVLSHVIGLFFPLKFLREPYFVAIFEGLSEALTEANYALIVSYEITEQLPAIFQRDDVDGLILHSDLFDARGLANLRQQSQTGQRPIVSLIIPREGCSAVIADDYGGGYASAEHLLSLGHRELLYFNVNDHPHRQRLLGYKQAFSDSDCSPDHHLHRFPWDFSMDPNWQPTLLRYLQENPRITGILAGNDWFAIRAINYLRSQGVDIPRQYSVVGFDDTDSFRHSDTPSFLTTVHVPLYDIGRTAAELIVKQVTGEMPDDTVMTLPTSLVIRNTTTSPFKEQSG